MVKLDGAAASLEGSYAKLRRAREHLDALHEAGQAFMDGEPYKVTSQREGEWEVAYVEVRWEPPIELSTVFGDFLQNLRSALDHLMWQLVTLDGGTPGGATSFPIFEKPEDFEGKRGRDRMHGLSTAHQNALRQLQPYPGHDSVRSRALEFVNFYARVDRHRVIHPAFIGPAREDVPFVFEREPVDTDVVIEGEVTAAGKRLEDGAEFARFRVGTIPGQPHVKVRIKPLVDIAFGERGLRLYALPTIGIAIGEVVMSFAADFPETG